MTVELKIGDLVECFETRKAFRIHAFHRYQYDVVIVTVVNNPSAGLFYVPVDSLVKQQEDVRGYLQCVHVPGAIDAPRFAQVVFYQ
jgi:hypothetical protein